MRIDFSGPPLIYSHDQISYIFHQQFATCEDLSGCVKGNGFGGFAVQGGNTEDAPAQPFDSSYHIQDLVLPAFAPYHATFTGYQEGYAGYEVEDYVGPGAVGQPFSLTVSIVPEPATWALMLIGFGGIAIMLRNSRRRQAIASRP
jgi:hypothetical protein